MEHIDLLPILRIYIRPMLHQRLYKEHIPMKGRKMQRRKSFLPLRRQIDPLPQQFPPPLPFLLTQILSVLSQYKITQDGTDAL